jgi:glycosyltransferase involved in cell wall biosynthesis
MFDYIIFTHIPVFYKINLYNELNKLLKIHVVFISGDTIEKRSSDFTGKNSIKFSYTILSDKDFQKRNKINNLFKVHELLKSKKYKKILVGGWDLIEFWYLIFFNSKSKNCLSLESTIYDSESVNFRGLLKKLFLSRVSTVFASGLLHKKLLTSLSYSGQIKITKGVGIINKPSFKIPVRNYDKKYLYVGRLSFEKNLFLLVRVFNNLPDFKLSIIGSGPFEDDLKEIASDNIHFLGAVDNASLKQFYFDNNFLILPSTKETWGLVVEEAVYFGMPVIISDRAGSSELIIDEYNGFVISPTNEIKLRSLLLYINPKIYMQLLAGCKDFSIVCKDKEQVRCYLGD